MSYTHNLPQHVSPQTITPDLSEEIKRYRAWLATERTHNNATGHREKTQQYIGDALKPVQVGKREIRTFAPFRRHLSALQTLTAGQVGVLGAIMILWALSLILYSTPVLTAVIAVITVFYLSDLVLNFWLCIRTLGHPSEKSIDDAIVLALADAEWPRYTVLCPLYREAAVVPQFVKAMQALDYPTEKLQILFLTEEDDVETRRAIQSMNLPHHFRIVTVPEGEPRTKPRACNYGLLETTGDYVVIYDAEDIPDPLQLKKAVLTFANHGSDLGCVQAKLNFYNPEQNMLTRWFTAEYSAWFDLILPGLEWAGFPLPLGGTSNHFRTEMLHTLGAWDPFNVTEDCDLGLRLARYHLKTVVMDSTTYEEANSWAKNWMRQRSRWIKGYMMTYLVHMRQPLQYLRRGGLREFFALQLVVGGKTAVLFVNPIMWTLLLVYLLFHIFVGAAYSAVFPIPVLYMGSLCLVFGNFFYTYIHIIGCMKRGQYRLMKWALLMPIYWAMGSVAAMIGLYQLIYKPHYWEKTQHGLHLRTTSSSLSHPAEIPVGDELVQVQGLTYADCDRITEILSLETTISPAMVGRVTDLASRVTDSLPTLLLPKILSGERTIRLPKSLSKDQTFQLPKVLSGEQTIRLPRFSRTQQVVPRTLNPKMQVGVEDAPTRSMQVVKQESAVARVTSDQAEQRIIQDEQPRGQGTTTADRDLPMAAGKLMESRHQPSSSHALLPAASGDALQFSDQKRGVSHVLQRPVLAWREGTKDPWLVATFVIACLASLVSLWYFFQSHQILLYDDAYTHLLIARSVFDNVTPGPAQLGGVELPLPHLLMLPFVWNNYLWRTGLAGSFVSMLCYVISVLYLFLAARRLTRLSSASFVGVLIFMLNPNVLYLQVTPLSELVLLATLTMSGYYLLAWAQDGHPHQLIWLAGSIFLATMTQYDAWFLFAIFLVAIAIIGRIRQQRWSQIEGNLFVFSALGGLGIPLWLLWCGVVFKDPFHFLHSSYSSQLQQQLLTHHLVSTYHDLWQSIYTYGLVSLETLGPLLFLLGIIGLVAFLLRRRLSTEKVVGLVFLAPLAFYVLSLFSGQTTILAPGAAHTSYAFYNVRYGIYSATAAALFVAVLATSFSRWVNVRRVLQVVLTLLILVQSLLIASNGIILLQEGQSGIDCAPTHLVTVYLAQHYAGGRILEDNVTPHADALVSEAGIDFKNMVREDSGALWNEALRAPATMVDWIIVNPSNFNDRVARQIDLNSQAFLSQFTLTVREASGLSLFHRNGLAPLPTLPIPPDLLAAHHLCRTSAPSSNSSRAIVPSNGSMDAVEV